MFYTIDTFLNSITMYRLVRVGLGTLAVVAIIFGFLGLLPYSGLALLVSSIVFPGLCLLFHKLFARFFKAPANADSSLITGLILFFIFAPALAWSEHYQFIGSAVLACAVAIASKYLLVVGKRHVFNPAAFAAFALGLLGNPYAVWWVGSKPLLPFTLILGFLIVKKIRRFGLVCSWMVFWIVTTSAVAFSSGLSVSSVLLQGLLSWPIIFFAGVMLTEPLTTPPTQPFRIVYGGITGVLFSLQFHVGPLFSTPELALVLGNMFAYFVSNKQTVTLRLLEKRELAPALFEFVFEADRRLAFRPGQYIEWTLPHANPDSRGIKRYFTIASSPNERVVRLGVRIGDQISSFKTALKSLPVGGTTYASHLMGDFVLPDDPNQKLVFIAGGIGITPFRSMVQYLMDIGEKRDIVLLYACASCTDFIYTDLFNRAKDVFGLKTVEIVTDPANVTPGVVCRTGYVDVKLLTEEVPDFRDRKFYLSGPVAMVKAYKQLLLSLSIPARNIATDYFPGF